MKGEMLMRKTGKFLLGLTAAGAAIGVAYAAKRRLFDCNPQWDDEVEDVDFDLDSDLDVTTNREYVPLRTSTMESTSSKSDNDTSVQTEDTQISDESTTGSASGNQD